MQIEHLTSAKNPLLKDVRRAIEHGELTSSGDCVAESVHLLDEAIRSGRAISCVIAAEPALPLVEQRVSALPARIIGIPEAVMRQLSSTETPQGVIALVRPREGNLEETIANSSLLVVLDGIQDPGNAGAIVRAAEAFGADAAVFLKGTASRYNAKLLRAAAGSTFRLPVHAGVDDDSVLAQLEAHGFSIFAAMPDGGQSLQAVDMKRRLALIIGSEGRGVRPQIRSRVQALRIPMRSVESLNAAVAAGILLYEASRQRGSIS